MNVLKHFKKSVAITAALFLIFVQPIYSKSSLLKKVSRAANVLSGPADKIVGAAKKAKKQASETYYWTTVSSSDSLNFTALHEAGHTVVSHMLGSTVDYTQVQIKKLSVKNVYEKNVYEGLTHIQFSDVKFVYELDADGLEKYICFLMAGGIATQLDYDKKHGDTGDQKQISEAVEEIMERESSAFANIFYTAKKVDKVSPLLSLVLNPSYVGKKDFDFKAKDLLEKCYKKTEKLLLDNRKALDALTEALIKKEPNEKQEKKLEEQEIKDIIDAANSE